MSEMTLGHRRVTAEFRRDYREVGLRRPQFRRPQFRRPQFRRPQFQLGNFRVCNLPRRATLRNSHNRNAIR